MGWLQTPTGLYVSYGSSNSSSSWGGWGAVIGFAFNTVLNKVNDGPQHPKPIIAGTPITFTNTGGVQGGTTIRAAGSSNPDVLKQPVADPNSVSVNVERAWKKATVVEKARYSSVVGLVTNKLAKSIRINEVKKIQYVKFLINYE